MKKYEIHLEGITPLVMNAPNLCNPFYKYTKQMKELTSIRKKTDETHESIAEVGFYSSIYFDDEIGIHVPVKCIKGSIWACARSRREGKSIKGILFEQPIGISLTPYEGKTPQDLWIYQDKKGNRPFVFVEQLRVQKNMITRTRAMFHKWSLKFIAYKDDLLDEHSLKSYIEIAGKEFGLCELRPEKGTGNYGKFELISMKEI